jgi:RNA polymerase sigma-70 factor (ECF subfamily)
MAPENSGMRDDGTDETIAQLWQTYHANLHRFIQQRVGETAVADDILQDVFLRVLARIETLQDQRKLQSWLYQITRHAIIDYYRTHQGVQDLPDDLVAPAQDDETHARQELAQCLLPLIQRLPDVYRDALMQSEIDGLTQQQVAAQHGLSLSGAKSRIQRGRALLRTLLVRCCRLAFDHRGTVMGYETPGSCDDTNCDQQKCVRPSASSSVYRGDTVHVTSHHREESHDDPRKF